MARTRVKICGLTRSEHAAAAAAAGADAIGLNFVESSARFVAPADAAAVRAAIPALVSCVGVFADAPAEWVEQVLARVPLDLLQFHGGESAAYCAAFGLPFIKALPADENLARRAGDYRQAAAILVDSVADGQFGGTGQTFDWSSMPEFDLPLILAGGLTPENVGDAIRQVRPFAVDVSGGVERSKGVKDAYRIEQFVLAVQTADGDRT